METKMKKNKFKRSYFSLMIIFFALHFSSGQDFHLSQYDASPQLLNPALTGMNFLDASDYRVNANFRSQWKSIPTPFNTYSIAGDCHTKRFGMGIAVVSDRAGNGNLKRMGAYFSGAYMISNDPKRKHNLSVGLQLGIFQRSLNPNNLNFDNQYSVDQGGFDNSISNNESFSRYNLARFDAGLGFNYTNCDSAKKVNAFGGFSVFHVTQPDLSFTSETSKLPMKFVASGGTTIKLSPKFIITPNILVMYQAAANEINIGVMNSYAIKETQFLLGGINYRNKDAVIFHFGLKRKTNIYRISYDANISKLMSYSHGRGAIEFSIIYNFTKAPKKNPAEVKTVVPVEPEKK
jgi:type IX secretion system PorP/SprF family membrane protein